MSIYDYTVSTIEGDEFSLCEYKKKILLIVNVASNCGFTSQYKELETLYNKYKRENLLILGFPCNQFGFQESGTNEQIQEFCSLNYHVSFPLFSKIKVNGRNADPLYKFLKSQKSGLLGSRDIKWNFTKFLIDQNGCVIKRYPPTTSISLIEKDIQDVTQK